MPDKYDNPNCKNEMKFEECELAILRHAVDETDKLQNEKIANSTEVKDMIKIVENFLREKKCICYGGTAINNILPKSVQFYNRDIEIPDYDFFSPNALKDAKELANIFYNAGYKDVEAKSGVHIGTYKVFVNFIPMADLSEMHIDLFNAVFKESIIIEDIHYCSANYLRMNMYIELSRPAGDVSRWEKVLKRLTLLNEYYPLETPINCQTVDFQRKMDNNAEYSEKIYMVVRDAFIEQEVVFFGGYASSLYSEYMPIKQRRLIQSIPDFDVLHEEPLKCAEYVKNKWAQFSDIKPSIQIIEHKELGEIIPEHIELIIGKDTIAFIYKPIACHNYNKIKIPNITTEIRIATIDTILSFYLAFLFSNATYYYKDRILCMANFLFEVEQKNRLNQNGLLKRFSIDCYGKQPTIESMRAEKAEMFKRLANKKGTPEYERWFLKYNPSSNINTVITYSKKKRSFKKRNGSKKKRNHWWRFQTRRNNNIFP
jgi:hypothetical protein